MSRKVNESKVFVSEVCRLFQCQQKNLEQRAVDMWRDNPDKPTSALVCKLSDFMDKCDDLVAKRYNDRVAEVTGGLGIDQLKAMEAQEKIRKLKLDNDETEGKLVNAAHVRLAWSKRMSNQATILDGVPTRIKTALPDIPQQVLAIIEDALIEARNAAGGAEGDIDETEFEVSENGDL